MCITPLKLARHYHYYIIIRSRNSTDLQVHFDESKPNSCAFHEMYYFLFLILRFQPNKPEQTVIVNIEVHIEYFNSYIYVCTLLLHVPDNQEHMYLNKQLH